MSIIIIDVDESRGIQLARDIEGCCEKLSTAFLNMKEVIDKAFAKGFATIDTSSNLVVVPPTDETLQKDHTVKVKSSEVQTFLQYAVEFANGIDVNFKEIVDKIKK